MEASDAALVARVRQGDPDAFRVLVDRYGRRVFRLAFRLVGNEPDAEDVVQDTFLRAYRNLGRFEEQAQFSTWIYSIASNRACDILRLRKRRGDLDPAVAERMTSPDPGPDRLAAGGEVRDRVRNTLDELTPQERVAFTLRHLEGCSLEEVSEALNVSAVAARNAVFRAVRKMRRALRPAEGEASCPSSTKAGT